MDKEILYDILEPVRIFRTTLFPIKRDIARKLLNHNFSIEEITKYLDYKKQVVKVLFIRNGKCPTCEKDMVPNEVDGNPFYRCKKCYKVYVRYKNSPKQIKR